MCELLTPMGGAEAQQCMNGSKTKTEKRLWTETMGKGA